MLKNFTMLSKTIYKNKHPTPFICKQGDSLKAIILDFSGTICDPHVIAPAFAFVQSFKQIGIEVTMQEARIPMGLRKDLHIQKMLQIPSIIEKWKKVKGRNPNKHDGEEIFKEYFIKAQTDCIREYCSLIPGTAEIVQTLQQQYGIKIGSTTGFTKEHTDIILQEAEKQGYNPDFAVAGDDIHFEMGFRPAPFMVFQNMMKFGLYDRRLVLKVDDTVGGVHEGLNAGVWTVGIYKYSNYTDVDSMEQWNGFSEEQIQEKINRSRDILESSGAHYVAQDINDLPHIVQDINKRIKNGEKP